MEPGGPGTSFSLGPFDWPGSFSCIGLEEESKRGSTPRMSLVMRGTLIEFHTIDVIGNL